MAILFLVKYFMVILFKTHESWGWWMGEDDAKQDVCFEQEV